ncbi:hypothetical protein SVAN01_02473 [Stagonosporopsis vannaccii]|nr:hypothetical protein SVAN01_02473 [Stagonosporopsis vannaccii]
MGDITPAPASARPGIMLVRPSLHFPTPSNAATFKRWTIMHFNDLLHCLSPPGSRGITRALRYISTDGQLLYTIHADDFSIWQTQPYYEVSRRLDLENTRDVAKGESKVLEEENGFGAEPMVWDVVDAKFGILEECVKLPGEELYHDLPDSLVSRGEDPGCELVTLSYTPSDTVDSAGQGGELEAPPKELTALRDWALGLLSGKGKVYSSVYRHRSDAQPEMHPPIAEGTDGSGKWVVCILVEGEIGEKVRTQLQNGFGGVKVGLWKGEVFMF